LLFLVVLSHEKLTEPYYPMRSRSAHLFNTSTSENREQRTSEVSLPSQKRGVWGSKFQFLDEVIRFCTQLAMEKEEFLFRSFVYQEKSAIMRMLALKNAVALQETR
jgi:hypothetical protein